MHLEDRNLLVETFILAFHCFAGCRLTPQLISDNITIFQSAAEGLKSLSSSEEVRAVLNHEGVNCKFILKKALWFGGFWECLVGLTKFAINNCKVLGYCRSL